VHKGGFGQRQPLGKSAAFLIVDVNRAFMGSQPKPIMESLEEYPHPGTTIPGTELPNPAAIP